MLGTVSPGAIQRKESRISRSVWGAEGSSRRGLPKRATSTPRGKRTHLQGWGLTILRVATGTVFLISGAHKLFGPDIDLSTLAERFGDLPAPFPALAATAGALVLFLCGAALVLGLFTRVVSVPLAVSMVIDIILFHPPVVGFSVEDNGFEYALLRLAACVALVVAGGGQAALSGVLLRGR